VTQFWARIKQNALNNLTLPQRALLARAEAERILARATRAFDPDEPRDESGKWTDGGGSDGGGTVTDGSGVKQTKPPKGAEHPGKGYSAHAWVDKKGVIHTSNVYDAQRALFENRKVELNQVKQISTLIKRLGETAAEMEEQGEKAPVFNLCDVSVAGTNLFCADQIGIPRAEMPVIPAKRTKDFIKHLKKLGYEIEKKKEKAENLRATQSEIDGAKVAIQMERIREDGFYKRLVVSKDDYILDGHHTWAGELGIDAKDGDLSNDKEVKIARVNIGITKLIEIADEWTKAEGIAKKPAGQKAAAPCQPCEQLARSRRAVFARAESEQILARLQRDFDEDKHPRDDHGRWTDSGGGDGGGGGGGSGGNKPAATPQGELFPGQFPPIPEPREPVKDTDFKDKIKLGARVKRTEKEKEEFLKLWDERVRESPEQFRKDFMGGLDGEMTVDIEFRDNVERWDIKGSIKEDNETIGKFDRTIDFEQNKAVSDYFQLNDAQTGRDVGKKLLAANVAKYQELGLDSVEVHANIDIGGYAWARYGYVPTDDSWQELSSSLYDKVGGASSEKPESWEYLSGSQQDEIKDEWMKQNYDDFYQNELENFRDSGQALAEAKYDLAHKFSSHSETTNKWAYDGLKGYAIMLDETGDKSQSLGPFLSSKGSSVDHVLANTDVDFDDRRGDGKSDPTFTVDPKATPELTDWHRQQIESGLVEVFNKEADKRADDVEPSKDNIEEYQSEFWDGMRDRDKYKWADDNGLIPEPEGSDIENADEIRQLLDSGEPKAIWAIADSSSGKDLLLGTDWNGVIDLHDKETMDRFNAYVGNKPKVKAA
jgi:hypothetical protein